MTEDTTHDTNSRPAVGAQFERPVWLLREKREKRPHPLEYGKRRGARDARAGLTERDCPYPDLRVHSGRLSYSRAWRNAWREGFLAERALMLAEQPKARLTGAQRPQRTDDER